MAELRFTHGTMGSLKTARLLAAAYNVEETGGHVLVAKPATDTKGDLHIVSRMGDLSREVDFLTTPDMDVEREVLRMQEERRRQTAIDGINSVFVDEAQFLEPEQVGQLLALAVTHHIAVQTYGLRTDFQTHTFPGSRRLLEVAHVITENEARCGNGSGCNDKAIFNARLVDGVFVSHGEMVAIDGELDVSYRALCAMHYMANVGPIAA